MRQCRHAHGLAVTFISNNAPTTSTCNAWPAKPLSFYTIADTGLSTVEASIALQHRDAGMDVRNQTVQSRTLASICEQYAQDRPIHFLKIDVEGHEETVLRGMDFSRWRPGSSSSKPHGPATRPGKPW